ncbi:AraC family transcriptional regulator [Paenibacillus shunpengii]|uniref:AraC family transcriptional regulator n=1 Tax=Paenibacillus shunpengii TaxID=2054424 RepID=A0ABW5SN30_9BACL|nr:AraC family transcriptional regulator [Paenibacillus sp. PDC88]SDX58304.1 AraC-type DNA-binding protein [Paenibacillus sp. PDC88]
MGVPTFLETGHMTEGFPIRVIHTGDQFNYAAHWHEEVEMVFVKGNYGRIGVNSSIYELQKGDVLVIKPGDVHCFLPGTQNLTIILFRMELFTSSFIEDTDWLGMKQLFNKTTVIPASTCKERALGEYLSALSAEESNRQAGYKWAMIARLYDFIVQLLRTIDPSEDSDALNWQITTSKKFEFIEGVCEYLEEHYAENIKLDQVADHIKFSKFYVCKLFKDIKGITLMEYLNHFRIIKSEWALLFSEDSILDIAVSHGFNNINSFNRLFKKYNNCTPSDFRKKHKTNNAKYEG